MSSSCTMFNCNNPRVFGCEFCESCKIPPPPPPPPHPTPPHPTIKKFKKSTDEILSEMAKTFKERNAVYGDNYKMVGQLMQVLHPTGLVQSTTQDHELGHLWSLLIVKISRFAISGLLHKDSIHDAAVYCAMIESILTERENKNG